MFNREKQVEWLSGAMNGRPALLVAPYDAELFGHWWFEGPEFLARVLRELPSAGVRVTTLRGALDAGLVGGPVQLPPSSWGSGKDWRVWDGARVADLVELNRDVQRRLLAKTGRAGLGRDRMRDGLARQALLALSSDWAFMVSKDSAANYARGRAYLHAERVVELSELIGEGRLAEARAAVERYDAQDTLFGQLDARLLADSADRADYVGPAGR
jgi:1,4-alpha-glucan branching enzyme